MTVRDQGSVAFHMLWAASERFPRPHVVGAWNSGLVEAWPETYVEQREEAQRFFQDFGDGDEGWTFWTTIEQVPMPEVPAESEAL